MRGHSDVCIWRVSFGPLLASRKAPEACRYKGKGLAMGRTLLAAVIGITCLLPGLTQAQTASSSGTSRAGGGRPSAPPPPSRSQPALPPGVPLVPPAPPSSLDRADIFGASPRTYAPRYDRVPRQPFYGYGGGGYVTDPFGYSSQPDSPAPYLDRYMRQGVTTGYLRLDVEPTSAQVYIDGLYVGTVADLRSGGYPLDAGPHRIEFRADGFNNQSVELRIRANDVLSYRGTLTARDQRPEQRAAAAPPKTFYVIPRCYAGDTPPIPEQLPEACKGAKVRTVPPVVSPSQPAAGTNLRK